VPLALPEFGHSLWSQLLKHRQLANDINSGLELGLGVKKRPKQNKTTLKTLKNVTRI